MSGTKTLETQYTEQTANIVTEAVYCRKINEELVVYESFGGAVGYVNYTINSLPPGLTYKINDGEICISGYPAKAGVFPTVVKAVDEMGNTQTKTCYFCIGSADYLATKVPDQYVAAGSSFSRGISVSGGSGSYVFTKDADATELTINSSSGVISGYIEKPGTYNISVTVTDSAKSSLSTKVSFKVHVKETVEVKGEVKDLTGESMGNNYYITTTNADKNAKFMYSTSSSFNSNGEFELYFVPGTWNIEIGHRYSGVKRYYYNVKVTKDMSIGNVVLNVCPVILVHPQGITNYNNIYWKSSKGDVVGYDSKIWVKPGAHQIESVSNNAVLYTLMYKSTATFTATNKLQQIAVQTTATPGNVTFTPVTGTFTDYFAGGMFQYYSYVPTETGYYNIYSNTGKDTVGVICESDYRQKSYHDGSKDFCLSNVELTAGKTYYIGVKYYSSYTSADMTVYIEKQS